MNRTKAFPWMLAVLFFMFLLSPLTEVFSQEKAEELYEAALFKKEAEGDLEGAIQIFLKIITEYPKNRVIAAKAQLQIGVCYEKLGLKEAQKAYQKVIENYPEQTEAVQFAKEKLSILLRAQAVVEKGDKDFKIRKVWTGSDIPFPRGGPFNGSISPDGRYLSLVGVGGTGDLGVLELATKKKRLLTHEASFFDSQVLSPIWSPDSNQVACGWVTVKDIKNVINPKETLGDLRIIGLDGSKPRVLFRNEEFLSVLPFDWSPDGKHILAGLARMNWTGQLVLISVKDGSMRVLKTFGDVRNIIPGKALFSPDGRFIVFDLPTKKDTRAHDIFLLSTDGSREIALVEHPADDFVLGWSPDQKRLVFASNRTGSMDIWVIRVAADGKSQGDPELVKKDVGEIEPIGFTRNGSFYYALQVSMVDVYIATLDLERGKVLDQPKKAVHRFVGSNGCPAWSPDGKYLAYKTRRRPDNDVGSRALHIRSIETGKEHEFIPELKIYYEIRWSPDSHSILTVGLDKDDCRQIYKIDAQTGDMMSIVQIDSGKFAQWATWSPDSKNIFYTSYTRSRNRCPILMYDLVTRQKKEIYVGPFMSAPDYLSLSPDGRFLAFTTFDIKTFSRILNVMPAAGGEPREVLRLKKGERFDSVAWSSDGQGLLFAKQRSDKQKYELWWIPVEEGKPQKLGLTMDRILYLSIHPDGQRIAFHSIQKSNEMWVMENFLPEFKDKK